MELWKKSVDSKFVNQKKKKKLQTFSRFDDLATSIIQRIHTALMSLDIIDHNFEFSQLNFNDLGITIDWFEGVQGLVSSSNPFHKFVKSMLELSKSQ